MTSRRLEVTDLLWSFDADGTRLPVRRHEIVAGARNRGQRRAAQLLSRLPASADGTLNAPQVDALGLRIHAELQRLGEELQLGRRIAEVVAALIADLPPGPGPVRVVDVGCGTGHVLREIAYRGDLPGVELVGVDLNPVLIAEATRLARSEGLDCTFLRGDALTPGLAVTDGPRTVMISSGFLHHLEADEIARFLAATQTLGVAAYAHWDIAPCLWSTLGAWIFHAARMREPVSRHDGVLSALRAHPAEVLLDAARRGSPAYDCAVREGGRWHPRALDVLRPLVGVRR
ncbi:class I SAM-dependent methyltransferase [Nocardioides sp.]|uniref:class I SAM-dependent methyltransferase n=1 Tax=Nocardioides sp. TaxID=35761 RepID=UPI002633E761|nr:class I SAM-dependent methyltransferase [Nocardioides sp.]